MVTLVLEMLVHLANMGMVERKIDSNLALKLEITLEASSVPFPTSFLSVAIYPQPSLRISFLSSSCGPRIHGQSHP